MLGLLVMFSFVSIPQSDPPIQASHGKSETAGKCVSCHDLSVAPTEFAMVNEIQIPQYVEEKSQVNPVTGKSETKEDFSIAEYFEFCPPGSLRRPTI